MRTILAALVLLAPADAGVKTSALPHGVDMRAPQPVARSADTDWLEQRRHEMKVLEAAEAAHDGEFETLNHRERAHRRRLQGRDPAHAGVREIERTLAVFKCAPLPPVTGTNVRTYERPSVLLTRPRCAGRPSCSQTEALTTDGKATWPRRAS
eukprot:COSAG05_NODE_373_length_10684_cov_22.075012_3_plen_153_part_00